MSKGETLSAGGQSFTATVTGDRAKDLLLFGSTNISAEGRNTTFIKGTIRPINALAESDIRKIVEYGVKQQIEIGKDVGEKEAVGVLGHETFVHADKDADALTEIDNNPSKQTATDIGNIAAGAVAEHKALGNGGVTKFNQWRK